MKASVHEFQESFTVYLEAEDIHEAAILTRMSMNATKEVQKLGGAVHKNSDFSFYVKLKKNGRASPDILRRK